MVDPSGIREIAAPATRRSVQEMAPYVPPTAGRKGLLRLDFNENTLGCSPRVVEVVRAALNRELLAVYPEYVDARAKLASFFGVSQESLVLTNGTDEAIQLIVQTYVEPGDEVVVLQPSYAMYRFYAEAAGAHIVEIPFRPPELEFPIEEICAAAERKPKVIFLANPNNPTGTGIGLEAIERLLQASSGTAVLVDEAYYEFSKVTALPLIPQYPNLFVSRTFSKAYGLAGLRIGCLFSDPQNIASLHKAQSPYSVNSIAVVAACAAVEDQQYIGWYVEEVLAARQWFYEQLQRLQIPYTPSQANFVLIQVGSRAQELCQQLKKRGILVRDRSYELPGTVRITIGTRQQMQHLVEALQELW